MTFRPLHPECSAYSISPRAQRVDDGIRTRDHFLGKEIRYQLRHIHMITLAESNRYLSLLR